MNIPTLDGPNWGTYSIHLQAAAWILGFWGIIKGEALGTTPQTYDHLPKPTTSQGGSHPNAKEYAVTKADWNKRNRAALGLIQATFLPVIWQDFISYRTSHKLWAGLENCYRKAGGGYNLPPIGQHGENSIHWFNRSIVTDTRIPGQ